MLHETVVLLSVISETVPEVRRRDRLTVEEPGRRLLPADRTLRLHGDAERPAAHGRGAKLFGVPYVPRRTSYFLGRETLLTTGDSKMFRWRKMLFSFISRNSRSATQYFGIPPDRVVELGMQIDL